MTSPSRSRLATRLSTGLVTALLALTAGCAVGTEDDELDTPRRTITASPSPVAAPSTVPVGTGPVSADDVVWSQGSRLHVDRRSVDVAPLSIDAFVAVAGGVYLLDAGELWFTDLRRVRGTGLADRTGLQVDREHSLVRVTSTGGGPGHTYDARTGRRVAAQDFAPASDTDRLGTRVALRVPGTGVLAGRRGPGRFAVGLDPQGLPVAVDATTGDRVPLRGDVPRGLVLQGWAGGSTFYGTVGTARSGSVVSCQLVRRTCSTLGRTTGRDPVRFGAGR